MFSAMRRQFGTAAMIVAVIALIAALGGVAIAASSLSGPEKKLIEKEARKWGKKYAKQGPPGKQGSAGTNGKDGAKGDTGAKGPEGEPAVCSEANPECILPSEATETGGWMMDDGERAGFGVGFAILSFPISLSPTAAAGISSPQPLGSGGNIHVMVPGDVSPPTGCTGGSVNKPKADPGNLCIYVGKTGGEAFPGGVEAGAFALKKLDRTEGTPPNVWTISTSGALLETNALGTEGGFAMGSFAITAP